MSETKSNSSYIKKENLYVFDLNKNILNSLESAKLHNNNDNSIIESEENKLQEENVIKTEEEFNPVKPKLDINFCSSCKIEIQGRDHFKTDLHNYNLKKILSGENIMDESHFNVENVVDSDASISGSDDDDDEEEEEEGLDTISEEVDEYKINNSPFFLFTSHLLKDDNENKLLAGYKCFFNSSDDPVYQLKTNIPNSVGDKSAIIMIGGGHFAAAIISHTRLKNQTFNKKSPLSLNAQQVNLLKQKTFHRYTTRRKQGGSQSANDQAGGNAHSAGASIRRYNEQALDKEVRELIESWKNDLAECKYIFVKANVTNKKIIVNNDSCIKPKDPRIMKLPFNTKRPTTSELKRSWAELSYLKIVDKPTDNIELLKEKARKQKELQSLKNSKQKQSTPVPNEENVKDPDYLKSEELIALLKKSKVPAIILFLKKNKISINDPLKPETKFQSMTPLHYASQQGFKQGVLSLLTNLKADPLIETNFGMTAAQLAKDDIIKQQFQLARYKLGESYTDWEKAKVGEPLSKDDIIEKDMKEKEEEGQEVERAMEAQLEKLRLQKEEARKNDKKVGSLNNNTEANTMEGMTDIQKRAYMREVRARAAEARMKK